MNWKNKVLRKLQLTKRKHLYNLLTRLKNKHSKLVSEAYDQGYEKAKVDITPIIVHTHQPISDPNLINDDIVESSKLNFGSKEIEEFDVRFLNSLKHPPDDNQRELIFSNSRNSLAIAGAGSGKSTSLIYRLLFLHTQCHVSLDDITVFSFTRASVKDFRVKLIEVFGRYGIEVSKEKSEKVIRTFHSKVLEMAKASFLNGNERIFEFIKDAGSKGANEGSIDEAIKASNEQFVNISELTDGQNELILNALDMYYNHHKEFKKLIDLLFIEKLKGAMDDETTPNTNKKVISKTEEFDKLLLPLMRGYFELGNYPGKQITFENTDFPTLKLKSDAYIPELNLHVVFYPEYDDFLESEIEKEIVLSCGFKHGTYTLIKRKAYLLRHKSNERVCAIRNERELLALKTLIDNQVAEPEVHKTCPRFQVRMSGDLGFSELQDAIYNLACFGESLGVPINEAAKHLGETYIKGGDKLFLKAVTIFWPFFTEKFLPHFNVVRFHDMFINFSNPENGCFDKLSRQTKSSLSNIFIDEFQDISPEVSHWIIATLRRLKGEQIKTSLMCVGDDYQSIYGWRGSSPEFINNYQKYFVSKDIKTIYMDTNYRSYQVIVSAAESALAYNRRNHKTGRCTQKDSRNRLFLSEFSKQTLTNEALKMLSVIINELNGKEWKKTETGLLILAKTNNVLGKLKKGLGLKVIPDWIQFETFHRSKGLEADYCFLVEDCTYDANHVLRNYLYKLAGFSLSYNDAQKEEAMRLAYVALTRAKLQLWWYVEENPTGSFTKVDNYLKRKFLKMHSMNNEEVSCA
ncbi:hypothetical protein EXT47_05235 [Pseudoalteromonas sp. CO342X]|uniref:UvrD-helicase domain-containing protein n=1 Tax=Pseudoalteromonas sp. CO342X TaxID=1777270 RepID=UPI001022E5FF|nr:UvrD-helicase domain-containing protein [Pseudoalteromonas sp. CO342X]RZG16732.1 hypothetical protein EXT47_05235 [Pseudoalteromonas sp. CO342X]